MTSRPRAVVTGASSGIGLAFADRLAADGYDLTIVARRADRLEELAARLRASAGADVTVIAADLTDAAALRDIEERIAGDGDLALLVNNAGFGGYGPFLELDPDLADRQIDLHLKALIRLTRAALPGMVERGRGAVVGVASALAFSGTVRLARPKRAVYAGTKAFIVTFTQILAQELEGHRRRRPGSLSRPRADRVPRPARRPPARRAGPRAGRYRHRLARRARARRSGLRPAIARPGGLRAPRGGAAGDVDATSSSPPSPTATATPAAAATD